MKEFLTDIQAYAIECWSTAIALRERRRQMWALLGALLAVPLVWVLGGKLEPTPEGFFWVAVWFTASAAITLFFIAPFQMWRTKRKTHSGTESERKESLDRLADKIIKGSRLLNRPVKNIEERDVWLNDSRTWTEEVSSEIEDNFGRPQAAAFRTIGVPNAGVIQPFFDKLLNAKKLRLKERLDQLKSFVNANSQKVA